MIICGFFYDYYGRGRDRRGDNVVIKCFGLVVIYVFFIYRLFGRISYVVFFIFKVCRKCVFLCFLSGRGDWIVVILYMVF